VGSGSGTEQDFSLFIPPTLPVRAGDLPETSPQGAGFIHSTAYLLETAQVNLAALGLVLGPSEAIVWLARLLGSLFS